MKTHVILLWSWAKNVVTIAEERESTDEQQKCDEKRTMWKGGRERESELNHSKMWTAICAHSSGISCCCTEFPILNQFGFEHKYFVWPKRKLSIVNCPVAHGLLDTCVVSTLNFVLNIFPVSVWSSLCACCFVSIIRSLPLFHFAYISSNAASMCSIRFCQFNFLLSLSLSLHQELIFPNSESIYIYSIHIISNNFIHSS